MKAVLDSRRTPRLGVSLLELRLEGPLYSCGVLPRTGSDSSRSYEYWVLRCQGPFVSPGRWYHSDGGLI